MGLSLISPTPYLSPPRPAVPVLPDPCWNSFWPDLRQDISLRSLVFFCAPVYHWRTWIDLGVKAQVSNIKVSFVSASYWGGFFIRQNLSIYDKEVKKLIWKCLGKGSAGVQKMKGGKLPRIILPIKLTSVFSSLDIVLKDRIHLTVLKQS